METQIEKVEVSINGVESKTKECEDCEMVIEIKNEIQQQKNYLQIMKDTLHSKCCNKSEIAYVENLDSSNWMFGDQTPE